MWKITKMSTLGQVSKKLSNLSKVQKTVGLLGVFLVILGVVLSLPNAFADLVPVSSVTITSEKLDYIKKDPGSFSIEKSAKWIARGKARITFDVDTVVKAEDKYRDIIFVLDISGSMDGDKLNRVKQDSVDLINTLLSDSNNKAALITFEATSQLVLPLTNDKDSLINTISNLTTGNTTNYYQALVNVDKILRDYKKEENRDCIVLFLTDGYPNEDTPNEEGQYNYLRKQYPYVTINGVQYEMGSDVLDPVKKVSDQQFIADMTNLNNVLFEASVAPITYDSFSITDYINNDYFEIDSVDNIVPSVGTAKLEYENNTPKVIWNIENLRSGSKAKLTIDVKLKDEFLNKGGLYPTNKKEEIRTEIDGNRENITSSKTPILSSHYQVIYDANVPNGCTLQGSVPENESKAVFEIVGKSDKKLTCDNNYQFKEWKIVTGNVKRINDNYFEMPGNDVVLRAVWSKVSVSKSIDGEIYVAPPSIIKYVASNHDRELWKYKRTITKIVFEDSISDKVGAIETFDISEAKNESVIAHIVANDDGTTYTAYIQGNEKVIANKNSSNLFNYFTKLESIEGVEYFDTSQVTSMTQMFYECWSLSTLDLSRFDTSQVANMDLMFYECNKLTTLDLSNFDTSQVTSMRSMFDGCKGLTSLDLSSFDTSNVTRMDRMFYDCIKLSTLNLSSFDTSRVTNMSKMLYGCSSLSVLDLSSFNTSSVINMSQMFYNCSRLNSLDLSSFRTSQVTDMSQMFYGCEILSTLDLGGFDTSQVTNMGEMFNRCNKLSTLNLSSFDTSRVTNMSKMFYGCGLSTLDLSSFNTSKVTNMYQMFYRCKDLSTLDLSSFDTSKVTDMYQIFYECSGLSTLDLSGFDTSQVTRMDEMFYGCSSLSTLDLSSFDTSQVTNMDQMFYKCNNLSTLNLSSFDTPQVTTMASMFGWCNNLISLDLSGFDTSKVTNMASMFSCCSSLNVLDLSNFDTGNVTNMGGMFSGCSNLSTLDLSRFNTSNVTYMFSMFHGCSSLNTLDLSSFDTSKVAYMDQMFRECSNLRSLDLSGFNTSQVIDMRWMFYKCYNLTTTITIMNPNTSSYFVDMFASSATATGSQITVNYTAETSDLVDKMIQTKSSNSNVVKGELVS